MLPLIKQIEIFSGIRTVYFNYKYFSICTRELLGCLIGILGWRQEVSSVAVQFRKRGEPKSVFIHVVHEKYRYLDVFVVIDVVIVQVP